MSTVAIATRVPLVLWAVAGIAAVAGVWVVRWYPRYAWLVWVGIVVASVSLFIAKTPPPLTNILRYPFFSRWFHAIAPALVGPFRGYYDEAVYRLVPFASAACMAIICAARVAPRSSVTLVAVGLTAATVPLLQYYSSILYLELPAACLMLIVCLDSQRLLLCRLRSIRHRASWYALITVGFIKETCVVFLLWFLISRFISRARAKRVGRSFSDPAGLLKEEFQVGFSVLTPLVVYLAYRSLFSTGRPYHGSLSNVLNWAVLLQGLSAIALQFGLISIVSLAGLIVLFRQRRLAEAIFLSGVIAGTMAFHLADDPSLFGYSRFSLFVLPAIMSLAVVALVAAMQRQEWLMYSACLITCLGNLYLSPLHRDGTKRPGWAACLADVGEHYYPYKAALRWIHERYGNQKVLFVNQSGVSPELTFMSEAMGRSVVCETVDEVVPLHGASYLDRAVAPAKSRGIDVFVVNQLVGMQRPPSHVGGLHLVHSIRNQSHGVAVFVSDALWSHSGDGEESRSMELSE